MSELATLGHDRSGREPKARFELEGRVIRAAAVDAGIGLGEFLDELCAAAIHAANTGQLPDSLVMDHQMWQELVKARSFERNVDVPLAILGLLVERQVDEQQPQ
ncbi:MAG TPA: hypothetical protein VIQ76_19805 [Propionibacteriaceae bacterium]